MVSGESKQSTNARWCQGEGGKRMSRGAGELEFLQAFMKRGFVTIPRMLYDYSADLGLDYDTIGKIFAVMVGVEGVAETAFGPYAISRRVTHDFDQLRRLIAELEEKVIIRIEEEGDELTFSFIPLLSRLRAIWEQYREQYEEEAERGVSDPAVAAAERLLGQPLSDRQVADIQDWVTAYGFDPAMVQAVIREGQRQGVTRMAYLNQIARQWYEEGIRSPEEAKLHVERHRKAVGKHKSVLQYLGYKRLTGAEQAMLDRWTDEWGFSNEVIIRACTEAAGVDNPLTYVNRILEGWQKQGVKTLAEAEQAVTEYKRRFGSPQFDKASRARKAPAKSNVILRRENKDDKFDDYIFKKFDD